MIKHITDNDLKKASQSKIIEEHILSIKDNTIFGDDETHDMNFKLLDGFGYCEDYKGNSYALSYPKLIAFDKEYTLKEIAERQGTLKAM